MEEDNTRQKTISARRHDRSRAYPSMNLTDALNRVTGINTNLGLNGSFNRESVAVGMGYSSLNGASARAVAALVHYGLLERDKDQYALSSLARKYLLPTSDNDQLVAMVEAALSPSLFSEIYESFKGQVIPKQFRNRLINEFGIQQKAADDVERIFRETMQTARLLQPNGILSADQSSTLGEPEKREELSTPSGEGSENVGSPAASDYLSVELPSGLIVSYSQSLAPAFAFGQFGTELKALDESVLKYLKYVKEDKAENEEG